LIHLPVLKPAMTQQRPFYQISSVIGISPMINYDDNEKNCLSYSFFITCTLIIFLFSHQVLLFYERIHKLNFDEGDIAHGDDHREVFDASSPLLDDKSGTRDAYTAMFPNTSDKTDAVLQPNHPHTVSQSHNSLVGPLQRNQGDISDTLVLHQSLASSGRSSSR
jgi:hypothetical protein